VALAAPLALGLFPRVRLPAIVLEIVLGIVIGPDVLAWVSIDTAIQVISLLGLAFLLFLAGLEVDYERFRGQPLRLSAIGYAISFGLALVIGFGLHAGGLVKSPLLIGIALSATSLGIVVPVLKDAGQVDTPFGQLVVAGASIPEIAPIVLLSLFFSGEAGGLGVKLLLLGLFGLFVLAVGVAVLGAEHSMRISAAFLRLQDTTAEIRIRASFLLLALFVVLAERLGLEAILGAFLAGAIIKLVDRDQTMTHPEFRQKLEAVGYGVFVPVFFVATGVGFELNALFANATNLARVPIILAALLVARGLPARLPIARYPHANTCGCAVTSNVDQLLGRRRPDRCTAGSDSSRRVGSADRGRPLIGAALSADGVDAPPERRP
jgi:Kef-type K+ transport system membrane component KefB